MTQITRLKFVDLTEDTESRYIPLVMKVKVKVANEWQEQVTGLGLEIGHRNYSMIDAQAPSPPT